MAELLSLSIVLPALNEEQIIEKAIVSCKRVAQELTQDYEILVVDDGSQDRTGEIIRQLAFADTHVKGLFLSKHMGYGEALSVGFYNAKKEFVFYTDSDLPIDIRKELSKAISMVSEDVDADIGYRINRSDFFFRRVYSIVYNFANRLFFGTRVKDINFSCKLLRRKVFNTIVLKSHSVFIDGELLAGLNRYGFKVKEFPATYLRRTYGHSKFNSLLYAGRVLLEMFIFWLNNYAMRRFFNLFNASPVEASTKKGILRR